MIAQSLPWEYGVAIATLGVLVFVVKLFFTFMGRHFDRNSDVQVQVAKSLEDLRGAVNELRIEVRHLRNDRNGGRRV